MSINTDPHQQEAASPLVLVVRSFLRYVAKAERVRRSDSASSLGLECTPRAFFKWIKI